MQAIIIARGNGYPGDTTFDGYEVLAEPLPKRESRVFNRQANGNGGTCYGAYSIKLAARQREAWEKDREPHKRDLFILMQHGAGREVMHLRSFYDGGAFAAALLAMPEPVQYAALYTLYAMADEADRNARAETRAEWSQAFCDGRIRKSRPKQGKRYVTIEPRAAVPFPPALQGERIV